MIPEKCTSGKRILCSCGMKLSQETSMIRRIRQIDEGIISWKPYTIINVLEFIQSILYLDRSFCCFSANLRCKGMFSLTDLRIAVVTHPFIFLPFLPCLNETVIRIFFWTKCLKFSSIFSIFTNSGANTTSAQGFSVMVPFLSIFCTVKSHYGSWYNWAGSQKSFKFGQRVFVMNGLGNLSQFKTGK